MKLAHLLAALEAVPRRVVACSGGVDSLLLATVAHRAAPNETTVAHTVTPAVPAAATARVLERADVERWDLQIVWSKEFADPNYLTNPLDRCYFCKTHLYRAISAITPMHGWAILSGANTDDLGEFRPGLLAAAENDVHHPYVEAGLSKDDIRRIARELDLDFADLPASPCLSSRVYTGTEVTPSRLRAVEIGEDLICLLTGITVVRCRVRDDSVLVEVSVEDAPLLTAGVIGQVGEAMSKVEPTIRRAELDPHPYRPGRAFTVLA